MALLRFYGISSSNSLTFVTQFEIPNNCNYNVTLVNKVNYINIQLNAGQTVPSTTFTMNSEDFITMDGIINLQFKQTQGTVVTTKPKIVVTQL